MTNETKQEYMELFIRTYEGQIETQKHSWNIVKKAMDETNIPVETFAKLTKLDSKLFALIGEIHELQIEINNL